MKAMTQQADERLENSRLLTVNQFHERFGHLLSKVGIYAMVKNGQLKHIRLGKKILIDVEAFLDGQKQRAKKAETPELPLLEKGAWTIDEAEKWSSLSKAVIRRAAHDRRFPAHRSGKGWVIPREPFQAWFNRGDLYTSIENAERAAARDDHGWKVPHGTGAKTHRKSA